MARSGDTLLFVRVVATSSELGRAYELTQAVVALEALSVSECGLCRPFDIPWHLWHHESEEALSKKFGPQAALLTLGTTNVWISCDSILITQSYSPCRCRSFPWCDCYWLVRWCPLVRCLTQVDLWFSEQGGSADGRYIWWPHGLLFGGASIVSAHQVGSKWLWRLVDKSARQMPTRLQRLTRSLSSRPWNGYQAKNCGILEHQNSK